MKVVITGGAGRLGPYLVRELLAHGYEVLSIDAVPQRENICAVLLMDLMDTKGLTTAFQRADAVVHLARKRFPYTEGGFDPDNQTWRYGDTSGDAERFGHNVSITYNVLTAALEAGVKRIVSGSSLAIYGLYYPTQPLLPDYLPVDENHPLRPQDPYGLSKLVGEDICDALSRKGDVKIASLRFAGIATEIQYPILRARRKEPLCRGIGALWSYIDARDAATACRLAFEANFSGHQAFNICATRTFMNVATEVLAQQYLPEVKLVWPDLRGNWSGYDTGKAQRALGFTARYLVENSQFLACSPWQ